MGLPLATLGQTLHLVADSWKPMTGSDLPNQGFSIDLTRKIFQQLGYELKVTFMPWSRIEKSMGKGKFDIISAVWFNDDRNEKLAYSEPYDMNRIVFISSKDQSFEYSGPASLVGKRIGLVSDYSYPESIMDIPGVDYQYVSDARQSIKMVSKNRIDLAVGDNLVMRYKASMHLEKGEALFFDEQHPVTDIPLYLAVSRHLPNHAELIDGFNRMVRQYKKDGTYTQLLKDHGLH